MDARRFDTVPKAVGTVSRRLQDTSTEFVARLQEPNCGRQAQPVA